MKRFLCITALVVFAAGLFLGGLFSGIAIGFMNTMEENSILDKTLVDAGVTAGHISDLNDGKIDKVVHFLNLKLDIHIEAISRLLEHCSNQEIIERAHNQLTYIARQRLQNPSKPESELSESDYFIQEILNEALK